jgi:hypothetical protein
VSAGVELALATHEQAPVLAILARSLSAGRRRVRLDAAAAGRTRVARVMAAGSRAGSGDEAAPVSRIGEERPEFADFSRTEPTARTRQICRGFGVVRESGPHD